MDYSAVINVPKKHKINYTEKLKQQYHTSRSRISITESQKTVSIRLEASDMVALIASCNSVLKETKLINEIASIGLNSTKKTKSKNI